MSTEMETRTIPRGDYYAVIGLLELFRDSQRMEKRIEEALGRLLGEEEGKYGYHEVIRDVLYTDSPSADSLLRALNVIVEEGAL